MHFIAAPDKFKGSMTAVEAAEAVARGIRAVLPEATVHLFPLSDGGEGLVEALTAQKKSTLKDVAVTGPLGKPVISRYGIIDEGRTAVIEMAAASGLLLVPEGKRDPSRTTTYGTGELIKNALDEGCKKIIVGIGGSATNDGGAGMATALGAELLDNWGQPLGFGGSELRRLAKIDTSNLDPRLGKAEVLVACDVNNPLTGPRGASLVYGPQKGASRTTAAELDRALEGYARIIKKDLGLDVKDIPGSGAAGGLGAGLIAFLGARLQPGIDLVLEAVNIEQYLPGCRLLITGEGKLDGQSASGKVPVGVARKAAKYNIPVIALAGGLEGGPDIFHREGITACFAIADGPLSLQESMARGPQLLETKTAELIRIWSADRAF